MALASLISRGNELRDLVLGNSEAMVLNGNVNGFEVRENFVHDCNNLGIDFIGFCLQSCEASFTLRQFHRQGSEPALQNHQSFINQLGEDELRKVCFHGGILHRCGAEIDTSQPRKSGK